jgi:hypothetical protein
MRKKAASLFTNTEKEEEQFSRGKTSLQVFDLQTLLTRLIPGDVCIGSVVVEISWLVNVVPCTIVELSVTETI